MTFFNTAKYWNKIKWCSRSITNNECYFKKPFRSGWNYKRENTESLLDNHSCFQKPDSEYGKNSLIVHVSAQNLENLSLPEIDDFMSKCISGAWKQRKTNYLKVFWLIPVRLHRLPDSQQHFEEQTYEPCNPWSKWLLDYHSILCWHWTSDFTSWILMFV